MEWDDTPAEAIENSIKVGTKKGMDVLKGGFVFSNLDFACAHVETKTPKGHIKTFKLNWVSGNGRWLHILMDRRGKVKDIVSDENECTEDGDDDWTNDIKKFGMRSVKAGINKLKKIYDKLKGTRGLFKNMLNNSFTMKGTKYNNLKDFLTKQNPYDLGDKVVSAWETAHNRDMSSMGNAKVHDFLKDLVLKVGDKKGYSHMSVILNEDGDVLDVGDILADLLI